MHVIVNGERKDIAAHDLEGLLIELDYENRHLAIAVNRQMVPRTQWGATALNSGDLIEILTPRQGG